MLEFLRKNAATIGGVIIFLFAATMFTGTFFFGSNIGNSPGQDRSINKGNYFALVGDVPVSRRKYENNLAALYGQYQLGNPGELLSPEANEFLQLQAFNSARDFAILLNGANSKGVDVDKRQLKSAIQSVLIQEDLKDEKALRKRLEDRGLTYKQYLEWLTEDLKVRAFVNALQSQVNVTKTDVDNQYREVEVQHILIKSEGRTDEDAAELASTVLSELVNGMDFKTAAAQFSEDDGTKDKGGYLGFIGVGKAVQSFEQAAFSLAVQDISQPVRTPFGYHIIQVLSSREIDGKPPIINYEEEMAKLKELNQGRVVDEYLQSQSAGKELTVNNASVKAVVEKMQLNFSGAIAAYNKQISLEPANPIPHYLLARLYTVLQNRQQAKDELEKTIIKAELNPQFTLPIYYLSMGNLLLNELYSSQKFPAAVQAKIARAASKLDEANAANVTPLIVKSLAGSPAAMNVASEAFTNFEKAYEFAKERDAYSLQQLLAIYTDVNDTAMVKKITDALDKIESPEEIADTEATSE
jgi:parvulin-like peptidyl-prolyl isomerase